MKIVLTILGFISLTLGVIGIFLPLLPTTPFLLLSAALFMRCSPRAYRWLIDHPSLGSYIRNYREHRAMPLRAKILSITLLWGSLLYGIFSVAAERLWLQALLLAIAIGVTWHLLSLNTDYRE